MKTIKELKKELRELMGDYEDIIDMFKDLGLSTKDIAGNKFVNAYNSIYVQGKIDALKDVVELKMEHIRKLENLKKEYTVPIYPKGKTEETGKEISPEHYFKGWNNQEDW